MFLRVFSRRLSTSFTYPKRISRSSTSILQSLNSCVETDGGNPAYQYVDDPFLIPTSAFEKRQFALSKSSGKKAARWIIDRYPDAFFYNVAVPSIPSFFPNFQFDEKDLIDPDEKLLFKLIDWNKVTKANEIYQKCLEMKVPLSDSVKLTLFDLLCMFNSENPQEILPPEENWYRRELTESNQSAGLKRTWKDNGLADQMFEQLKISVTNEQKIRLYNSFASGLFKYNQIEKGMTIIDEMKQNQIPLILNTFNYLLRATSLIKETPETRLQFVLDLLKEMKENQIKPNLRTFNAVLYTIRRCSIFERGPTLALNILNEMKKLHIEPSLGSWAHILMIFYPNDQLGYETGVLQQIFDRLEKEEKEFEWRDVDDGEFFFNAMFKATVNCRDIELAKRVHRFLMKGSNSRFIPDGFKEQMYYTNFFRLLFRIDLPENVMPLWESLVPNICSPSSNLIEEFMEFLSTWNITDYYVRLWSDLLVLGLLDNRQYNRRIVERYLTLLNRTDPKSLNDEQRKQYGNIARQVLKKFPLSSPEDEENEQQQDETKKPFNKPKFEYNGQILSNLICLLGQSNDIDGCLTLFDYYLTNRQIMVNPLSERSLSTLVRLSAEQTRIDRAFQILELINELNYDCLADGLDLLNRNVHLSPQDRQRLRNIQKNATVESAHLIKLL